MTTTFICMDGLGGDPIKTFSFLKEKLGQDGFNFILVTTSNSLIWGHRDRINKVRQVIDRCSDSTIILVGQSAGGSAVQSAAAESSRKISGVIALSPALPRWHFFLTPTLLKMMLRWKNLWRFMLGRPLQPTKKEYASLISPFRKESECELLDSIWPISGKESRELAFYPPKRSKVVCPTLIVFGTEDHWVSSRSLRKFAAVQKQQFPELVSILEIGNSGHLTLFSENRESVTTYIKDWVSLSLKK